MFNLKKTVIKESNETNNESLNARIVTLWGSSNSGKSSLATIIGKTLAKKNKNKSVIIVYTEENLPIVPCIFPNKKLDNQESLGNLYTPIKITENYIIENLTTFKSIKNMCVLGFKAKENYAMYPSLTENLCLSIIEELNKMFDYVIIDGATFFNSNQLTFSYFEHSDAFLKVCTQDVKSVSYFASQDKFLESIGLNLKNCKTIINKVNDGQIVNEIFNKSNKYDYLIPYSKSLENNFNNGDLLLEVDDNEFWQSIDKIIKEVF